MRGLRGLPQSLKLDAINCIKVIISCIFVTDAWWSSLSNKRSALDLIHLQLEEKRCRYRVAQKSIPFQWKSIIKDAWTQGHLFVCFAKVMLFECTVKKNCLYSLYQHQKSKWKTKTGIKAIMAYALYIMWF